MGPSPRVRVELFPSHHPWPPVRLISAFAGKPCRVRTSTFRRPVYPRACGGNHRATVADGAGPRSIPAPAGKPFAFFVGESTSQVYPRACGETPQRVLARDKVRGLSPRLRGNLLKRVTRRIPSRSIPAPAGKPPTPKFGTSHPSVYPRACGETTPSTNPQPLRKGLSPRLRGNLGPGVRGQHVDGSIPAPAGKPRPRTMRCCPSAVYPRACGETSTKSAPWRDSIGLSPRLRGNHRRAVPSDAPGGSIPAPAGKPGYPPLSRRAPSVYPRACGETRGWILAVVNLEVYPRACGETSSAALLLSDDCGLSPRLRGNLGLRVLHVVALRSIPAPAGKPNPVSEYLFIYRVYPRACGETMVVPGSPASACGLSPRLRGNRF